MINRFKTADAEKDAAIRTDCEKSLFTEEEMIINEIVSLNPDGITPINALQLISEWKKKLMQGQ